MTAQITPVFIHFPHIYKYRFHFFITSRLSYKNNSCEPFLEHYHTLYQTKFTYNINARPHLFVDS